MKEIIEYLSAPENRTYSLILAIAFVVLAIATVVVVVAYSKKKRKEQTAEIQEHVEEKAIPENIVDAEMLSEYAAENADDEILAPQSATQKSEENEEALSQTENVLSAEENTEEIAKPAEPTETAEPAETDEKPTAKQPEQTKTEEQTPKRYAGKWLIVTEADGRLYAYLKASNGEKMLATEGYTSLSGIKSGIDTLKKNIQKDNYAINLDKNGNFVFKIFSGSNRLLCVGEGYTTREQCEKAFASVKRFAASAVITVENKTE